MGMSKLYQTKTNINVRLSVNRQNSSGTLWFVKPQLYPLCIRECGYRRNCRQHNEKVIIRAA